MNGKKGATIFLSLTLLIAGWFLAMLLLSIERKRVLVKVVLFEVATLATIKIDDAEVIIRIPRNGCVVLFTGWFTDASDLD